MGKGQNVPIPIAQYFDAALESQIHRHLLSQWQRAIEKCRPAFGDFLNADDVGENFDAPLKTAAFKICRRLRVAVQP